MPKGKVTLLDRAKGDLLAAKSLLTLADGDDVVMDICAYHLQQCAEKVAKYMILLQGDLYTNDHRSNMYLEDLNDNEVKEIIEGISGNIDSWATTIRYSSSILSSKKAIIEVLAKCEKLIELATIKTPSPIPSPSKCVSNKPKKQ